MPKAAPQPLELLLPRNGQPRPYSCFNIPFGPGVFVTARLLRHAHGKAALREFPDIQTRAVLAAAVRVMYGKRPLRQFLQRHFQGADGSFDFKGIPGMETGCLS
jgi:hypothetical protein